MLSTLIESRRGRSRSSGGTAVSVIVHAVVITLVAAVTAHASDDTPVAEDVTRHVIYVAPQQAAQPETQRSVPARVETPSQPKIPDLPHRRIEVSNTIPTEIPPVNPSLSFDTSLFVIAEPVERASAGSGSVSPSGGSGSYSAWQVEKAVVPLSGNPKPEYPSMLQSAHVDGEVLAQFVVDTTGRVDMSTFRALQATNELFVSSVRRALAEWKFRPAEVEGVKVRQLVQMPLTFKVR